MPLIAFIALALIAQFAWVYPGTEPYPSIAMPGFEGITRIDDPNQIRVAFVRLESDDRIDVLSRAQVFESAPPGQRNRMIRRLEGMTGTDAEWLFLEEVADRLGYESAVTAAAVVLRDGYGNEELLVRIDRQP